jgi:hypothetical protein
MRFIAPPRAAGMAARLAHPVFAGLVAGRHLLDGEHWPDVSEVDAALQPLRHHLSGKPLRFIAQDSILDESNYELRILGDGVIATRSRNWHDLLNALVWKRFTATKSALNAAQARDMRDYGLAERSRRQCALTQFDEGGAVLLLRERAHLDCWNRHDWPALFLHHRDAWLDGRLRLEIFGHALLEHALDPHILLLSKTIAVMDEDGVLASTDVDALVAAAIARGDCLADPQDLRPLPLAGIPGWHDGLQDGDFYRLQPCFRPLREGRIYPEPLLSTVPEPA